MKRIVVYAVPALIAACGTLAAESPRQAYEAVCVSMIKKNNVQTKHDAAAVCSCMGRNVEPKIIKSERFYDIIAVTYKDQKKKTNIDDYELAELLGMEQEIAEACLKNPAYKLRAR